MLIVAITPAPFWVMALLCASGLTLGAASKAKLSQMGWTFVSIALLPAVFGLAALYFTSVRSISAEACLTGIFGSGAVMLELGAGLVLFLLALIFARQRVLDFLRRYKWLIQALIVTHFLSALVFMRSMMLCTV